MTTHNMTTIKNDLYAARMATIRAENEKCDVERTIVDMLNDPSGNDPRWDITPTQRLKIVSARLDEARQHERYTQARLETFNELIEDELRSGLFSLDHVGDVLCLSDPSPNQTNPEDVLKDLRVLMNAGYELSRMVKIHASGDEIDVLVQQVCHFGSGWCTATTRRTKDIEIVSSRGKRGQFIYELFDTVVASSPAVILAWEYNEPGVDSFTIHAWLL